MSQVMLERLRAESDSDHLSSSFEAFDLPRILEARLDRPVDPAIGVNNVRRSCIRGFRIYVGRGSGCRYRHLCN